MWLRAIVCAHARIGAQSAEASTTPRTIRRALVARRAKCAETWTRWHWRTFCKTLHAWPFTWERVRQRLSSSRRGKHHRTSICKSKVTRSSRARGRCARRNLKPEASARWCPLPSLPLLLRSRRRHQSSGWRMCYFSASGCLGCTIFISSAHIRS